jgi:hypothetical protein
MADAFDIDSADARDTQRRDTQRSDRERADNDLRFVMADARGRHFVWQLLGDAGLYRSTFSADALVMAHNEGKRDMGLRLLDRLLRVTPGDYLKAQTENVSANS